MEGLLSPSKFSEILKREKIFMAKSLRENLFLNVNTHIVICQSSLTSKQGTRSTMREFEREEEKEREKEREREREREREKKK